MESQQNNNSIYSNPWGVIRKMGRFKYITIVGVLFGILPCFVEGFLDLTNKSFQEVFFTSGFVVNLIGMGFGSFIGAGLLTWYVNEFFYKKSLQKKRKTRDFEQKDDWEEQQKKGVLRFSLEMGLFMGLIAHVGIVCNKIGDDVPFSIEALFGLDALPTLLLSILVASLTFGLGLWHVSEYHYKKRQANIAKGKDSWDEIRNKGLFIFMLKIGLFGGCLTLLILFFMGYEELTVDNLLLYIGTTTVGALPLWYVNEYVYKQKLLKEKVLATNHKIQIESSKTPISISKETIEISAEEHKEQN